MSSISTNATNLPKSQSLQDKLRDKFGDKFNRAQNLNEVKKKDEDTVELSGKSKDVKGVAGDIKENNPDSDLTQAKLKGLIKTGGFNFSDKERSALAEILDV